MRRLMASCSLRARTSVSATSTALAPRLKAASAKVNHRAASLGLMRSMMRVPRSSGGCVARGAACGSAGFFGDIQCLVKYARVARQCSIQYIPYVQSDLFRAIFLARLMSFVLLAARPAATSKEVRLTVLGDE